MRPSTLPEAARRRLLHRFAWALRGVLAAWRTEQSFRIELAIAGLTVAAGLTLHLTGVEWLFVIGAIGAVLALELLNTAIERTLDLLHPDEHETVKVIKDVAAGAVLLAAGTALVIGLLVFVPHLG